MRSIDVAKKLNALKARQQLGQLLEEVYYQGEQYIIERAGKPMAAVVPVWFIEAWHKRREQFFAMVDDVHARNADVPPDMIERDVVEAVQQVRRDMAQRRP
jgi:prevent-host-death family protein